MQRKLTKYFNSLFKGREKQNKTKQNKTLVYSRFDNWIINNLKKTFLKD